jgi:hypothetical protein
VCIYADSPERLLKSIGIISPVEYEAAYNEQENGQAMGA